MDQLVDTEASMDQLVDTEASMDHMMQLWSVTFFTV